MGPASSPADGEHPEGGVFDLERFVRAQDANGTFDGALGELRAGRKRTHWMWFVFPQIAGLGHSTMAQRFAISSLGEAQAYLRHPVLGPRLVESAGAVLAAGATGSSAEDIVGPVDALKLRSSMTLFSLAERDRPEFRQLLDRFFAGRPDPATLGRLEPRPPG